MRPPGLGYISVVELTKSPTREDNDDPDNQVPATGDCVATRG